MNCDNVGGGIGSVIVIFLGTSSFARVGDGGSCELEGRAMFIYHPASHSQFLDLVTALARIIKKVVWIAVPKV